MNVSEVDSYLKSFINHERNLHLVDPSTFKLERVRQLLNSLGNPQTNYKIVHVAGSKGKGSSCAYVSQILKESGYKVGLYTSPHINHYRERIRVLFKDDLSPREELFADTISDEGLAETLSQMRPSIDQVHADKGLGQLSFFEIYTVLALNYFSKLNVDVAVLETGLGGRLDATNAFDSHVCAITPISLEHTQILGETVEQIAQEKAAIIKNESQQVVLAEQPFSVMDIFQSRCKKYNIQPLCVGRDILYRQRSSSLEGQVFDVQMNKKRFQNLKTPLLGEHQVANVTLAIGIIELLRLFDLKCSLESIYRGCKQVVWPARFEIIRKKPLIILDGAHNKNSAQALVRTIQELLPGKEVTLVLGMTEGKKKIEICRALSTITKKVIATKADHPRSGKWDIEELKQLFINKSIMKIDNVFQAVEESLKEAKDNEIILITGSLFVASEARRALSKTCINTTV